ncbi:MAG: hypothetical protein U9P00_12115 [Pseudomonadota bacterium]|nr:hypothetical protein [Pseudomonadota bacterium]
MVVSFFDSGKAFLSFHAIPAIGIAGADPRQSLFVQGLARLVNRRELISLINNTMRACMTGKSTES